MDCGSKPEYLTIYYPCRRGQKATNCFTRESNLGITCCEVTVITTKPLSHHNISITTKNMLYIYLYRQYFCNLQMIFIKNCKMPPVGDSSHTFDIEVSFVPVFAFRVDGLTLIHSLILILHVVDVQQTTCCADLMMDRKCPIYLPPSNLGNRTIKIIAHTYVIKRLIDSIYCNKNITYI